MKRRRRNRDSPQIGSDRIRSGQGELHGEEQWRNVSLCFLSPPSSISESLIPVFSVSCLSLSALSATMSTIMQKIKEIEVKMARTQKNKATTHHLDHLMDLQSISWALKALMDMPNLLSSTKGPSCTTYLAKGGGGGEGFDVTKSVRF
ncbi:hypothetical protein F2Q69_00008620 [Brassica cretica]|uniref:Uncharacterized protein n=1 Tax=Brassica cretica TaxID=69181 RepID=A0A8S9PH72_BRACR|nr:hypothetical protein F2Q69_00008620 [Brassica cretica]